MADILFGNRIPGLSETQLGGRKSKLSVLCVEDCAQYLQLLASVFVSVNTPTCALSALNALKRLDEVLPHASCSSDDAV